MAEAPVVFAAMLCRTPQGVGWAAIGQIAETRGVDGATAWLGNTGEVRCRWMLDVNPRNVDHTCVLYRFTGDADADAAFYPAGNFIRKVDMLPRKHGAWLLKAADATAVLNAVWAFNMGHFMDGHRQDVDCGGVLQGPRPMLSRILRDAVHSELADDRVKKGSARVDSVARVDFVAMMASKAKHKVASRNERQLAYAFHNVRLLDSIFGGPGWDATFHVGDAGMNVVVTKKTGADGRRVVARPVRVSFLEKKHKRHGLRGYGHILVSFIFEWDKDNDRRLIGI